MSHLSFHSDTSLVDSAFCRTTVSSFFSVFFDSWAWICRKYSYQMLSEWSLLFIFYFISLTSVLKFLQTFLHDVSIPFNLPMSNHFIHTIYWVHCCIFVPPPLIKYLALMFVEFHSQLSSTSIVSLLECYSNYSLSQFFSCFAIFFF